MRAWGAPTSGGKYCVRKTILNGGLVSRRMKVLTVVGARPQFIKAAPVSRVLRRKHEEFLLHTGQHYDDAMSDLFFRQLSIPAPDRNLEVGSGPHGAQTAAMLSGIEAVALDFRPDWLVVYRATN